MRFSEYVIFMFCCTAVFYLLGVGSLAQAVESSGGSFVQIFNDKCPLLSTDSTGNYAFNSGCLSQNQNFIGMLLIIIGAGVGFLFLLLSGYSAMYVIPIIMLLAFLALNVFVFPLGFIIKSDIPLAFKVITVMFFNIITLLAMMSFIRGDV